MKSSPFVIILVSVFIALVGFGIVIPLLPIYAERYGAGGFEVGMLLMVYSAMQFLVAPFAGRLSDRIGRRPVILVALLITTISYVVFGLADSLFWLFISRVLAGLGGADITVAQAYIADVTSKEDRSKGMGLFGAAFGVGFTVGPVIGGLLAPVHPSLPAYIAAGFTGITFVFAFFKLPEPDKHEAVNRPLIRSSKGLTPEALKVTRYQFQAVFIQSLLQTMLVLYTFTLLGWMERKNGFYLLLIGATAAIIQGGLFGKLARRFGERSLVIVGFFLMAIGMLFIAHGGSANELIIGGILNAMGFAVVLPSLASLVSLTSDPQTQGATMGLFQSAGSLARIIAPVIGGLLFDNINMHAPFYTACVIAFITAIFAAHNLKELEAVARE